MNLTFWNVGRRCVTAPFVDKKTVLDLSDVTFITPFALMYVGMFLRHFSSQGETLSVKAPHNESVRNYLARQQFWKRFNFDAEAVATESIQRQPTLTSLNDIVDLDRTIPNLAEDLAYRVIQVLQANTSGLPWVTIEETVAELIQNFVLATGDDYVVVSKGKRRAGPMGFTLPGVQIELMFQASIAW
jgi:hypothetical protein